MEKYLIFLDKDSDRLIVEALECLEASTKNEKKSERIKRLLHGMFINRPYKWGRVQDIYQPPEPNPAPPSDAP